MQLHRFLNALKILRAIDRHEWERGGVQMSDHRWDAYRDDPIAFICALPDAAQIAAWKIIEGRQP